MNPRKGLRKRFGGYVVSGPNGDIYLDRDRNHHWRIRPAWAPPAFYWDRVRGLFTARRTAERLSGIELS